MNIGNKSLSLYIYMYIVVSYKFFVSLRQLYVYQVDFDEIISRHTQKMEMEDTSNSTSFMKSMITRKGCAIRINDYRKRLCYMYYYRPLGFVKPAYKTFRFLMHRAKQGIFKYMM